MKAMTYHRYGGPEVLSLEDVEKPSPAKGEVLVRVHAAAVNPVDWHFLTATPFMMRGVAGLRKPKHKILGMDAAGTVEAVGEGVTQWQAGDPAFGMGSKPGAFAEYVRLGESEAARKPDAVSWEEAASCPVAGLTALQALRDKGDIQPGKHVLINGASGGVGTFAVQLAKHFEAEATGVCSTRNLELVRSLGAAQAIDYTQDDFTQQDKRYDLIFDLVGNHPLSALKRVLTPRGIYVTAAGQPGRLMWLMVAGGKRMTSLLAQPSQKDLTLLGELMAGGEIKAVIDRRYPLNELPDALRYIAQKHARGKVVITI